MSVAKNIEISSTSPTSFEDAIEKGIARAARTIKNVSGAWIKDQKINISGGVATEYQVMMIITFVLDDASGDEDDDDDNGGGSQSVDEDDDAAATTTGSGRGGNRGGSKTGKGKKK